MRASPPATIDWLKESLIISTGKEKKLFENVFSRWISGCFNKSSLFFLSPFFHLRQPHFNRANPSGRYVLLSHPVKVSQTVKTPGKKGPTDYETPGTKERCTCIFKKAHLEVCERYNFLLQRSKWAFCTFKCLHRTLVSLGIRRIFRRCKEWWVRVIGIVFQYSYCSSVLVLTSRQISQFFEFFSPLTRWRVNKMSSLRAANFSISWN